VNEVEKYVNFEILQNQPPVITKMIVPVRVKTGSTADMVSLATDKNGDALTYKWSITGGNGTGSIANAGNKTAQFTAGSTTGKVNIELNVTDSANNIVSRATYIQVIEDQKPVISHFRLSPLSVVERSQLELKASYADRDGTIKAASYTVYAVSEEGDSLIETFDAPLGVTTYTATSDMVPGKYKVILKVTDNADNTTESSIDFTVVKANEAPTITSLTYSKSPVLPNEEVTLNVVASDADEGDSIAISWSVSSGGNIEKDPLNSDKAVFKARDVGIYTVTVIATDSHGLKAVKSVKIEVKEATLSITRSASSVKTGEMVTFPANMSSGDTSSHVIWTLVSKPEGSESVLSSSASTATLTPDKVGGYDVNATVELYGVTYRASSYVSATDPNASPDVEGVVRGPEGELLSGAQLRLYNSEDATVYDETTTTDSDGHYGFDNVPAGTYYLVIYAGDGYIAQTQVVEVGSN